MLPDTQYFPALPTQLAKVAPVALTRRSDLTPPFLRQFVLPKEESPAVPEISIKKHCQLCSPEDNIGPAGLTWMRNGYSCKGQVM